MAMTVAVGIFLANLVIIAGIKKCMNYSISALVYKDIKNTNTNTRYQYNFIIVPTT